MQDEFNNAKQTFECDPTNKNASDFNTAKERLEHFYEEKLQGIIIRARARWCEYGEKKTKYFLNLEKRNHVKKHLQKLTIFTSGEMSRSQKQAVITLIEKKGKDRSLLENWRPISLVNVDAKIISKVLATRIKNVLPSIIHHNQSGFVKDRFIGETVRSIFDLMEFSLKENIPGLTIFIDFHKAFDSLEWNFLFSCLEAFGFGLEFIRCMGKDTVPQY